MRDNMEELSEPLERDMRNLASHLLLFMAGRSGFPNSRSIKDTLTSIADVAERLERLNAESLSPREQAVITERVSAAVKPTCLHREEDSSLLLNRKEREIVIRALRIVGHELTGAMPYADRAYQEFEEELKA